MIKPRGELPRTVGAAKGETESLAVAHGIRFLPILFPAAIQNRAAGPVEKIQRFALKYGRIMQDFHRQQPPLPVNTPLLLSEFPESRGE